MALQIALSSYRPPTRTHSPDGEIVVGHDGYLFLEGGTNRFLDQYQGVITPSPEWLDRWVALAEARAQSTTSSSRTFISIVMPDTLAVHPHLYPEQLDEAKRPIQRLIEAQLDLIYPIDVLRGDLAQFCRKTDSHYTTLGTHAIYECIASRIPSAPSIPPPALRPALHAGDLGSRLAPPIVEPTKFAASNGSMSIVEDNWPERMAAGGHRGTRRVFRNHDAPDNRRVVVFGDSFAHLTEQHDGLCWFIAQAFSEVHFIWSPFGWDPRYVEKVDPAIVIHEIAERFITSVPSVELPVEAMT